MKIKIVAVMLCLLPTLMFGQFKNQAGEQKIGAAISRPGGGLLLGFINPDRLHMSHQFSVSYLSAGGRGMMLNSYLNTIDYQISNPLSLQLNIGLLNSPYNGFSNAPAINTTDFFGGAVLRYKPNSRTAVSLGVNVAPNSGLIYSPYLLRQ